MLWFTRHGLLFPWFARVNFWSCYQGDKTGIRSFRKVSESVCERDNEGLCDWVFTESLNTLLYTVSCLTNFCFAMPTNFRCIRFILVLDSTEYKTAQITVIYIRSFSLSLFPFLSPSPHFLTPSQGKSSERQHGAGIQDMILADLRLLFSLTELWYGLIFYGPRLLLFHHILLRHQYRDYCRGR